MKQDKISKLKVENNVKLDSKQLLKFENTLFLPSKIEKNIIFFENKKLDIKKGSKSESYTISIKIEFNKDNPWLSSVSDIKDNSKVIPDRGEIAFLYTFIVAKFYNKIILNKI